MMLEPLSFQNLCLDLQSCIFTQEKERERPGRKWWEWCILRRRMHERWRKDMKEGDDKERRRKIPMQYHQTLFDLQRKLVEGETRRMMRYDVASGAVFVPLSLLSLNRHHPLVLHVFPIVDTSCLRKERGRIRCRWINNEEGEREG